VTHAPTTHFSFDEEILQPRIIVPSQQVSCDLQPRRRESPVETRTCWPSAGPFVSSANMSQASAEEARHEQPYSTKMNGQGHPTHDPHSVAPEVISPSVSSPESGDSRSLSHSHTPSPKITHRTMSRSCSPPIRSPTPDPSSHGMRINNILPRKKAAANEPILACFFCRKRKIACGPPLPGSTDKSCK
jgi:hypothetical protein